MIRQFDYGLAVAHPRSPASDSVLQSTDRLPTERDRSALAIETIHAGYQGRCSINRSSRCGRVAQPFAVATSLREESRSRIGSTSISRRDDVVERPPPRLAL